MKCRDTQVNLTTALNRVPDHVAPLALPAVDLRRSPLAKDLLSVAPILQQFRQHQQCLGPEVVPLEQAPLRIHAPEQVLGSNSIVTFWLEFCLEISLDM